MVLSKSDQECLDHLELTERIRKTLYYGRAPSTERPSLPVTEIAVEFLQDAAPRELGRVDSYIASSVGKKACVSPCSMMLGMLYIERLKHRNPEYLQQVSSSDLFLVSMMVASKYLYDEGIDEEVFNDEWAESANMDVEELNDLEQTFLTAIDWSLFVKSSDFWKVLGAMERRIARDKGLDRGYFTYTDLHVLSQDDQLYHAIQQVACNMGKVMIVCSVAYVAGALTLVVAPLALNLLKMEQLGPADSLIWGHNLQQPGLGFHLETEFGCYQRCSGLEASEIEPDYIPDRIQPLEMINLGSHNSDVRNDHLEMLDACASNNIVNDYTAALPSLLPAVVFGEAIMQFAANVWRKIAIFPCHINEYSNYCHTQMDTKLEKMVLSCPDKSSDTMLNRYGNNVTSHGSSELNESATVPMESEKSGLCALSNSHHNGRLQVKIPCQCSSCCSNITLRQEVDLAAFWREGGPTMYRINQNAMYEFQILSDRSTAMAG